MTQPIVIDDIEQRARLQLPPVETYCKSPFVQVAVLVQQADTATTQILPEEQTMTYRTVTFEKRYDDKQQLYWHKLT